MSHIKIHSELMEQIVPETAIPPVDRFYVARYSETQYLIFSRGSNGVLYLVLTDKEDGKNRLINLSSKFGLTRKVSAFSVSQDKDLKLYLVVAEEGEAGKGSVVHIMKPTYPSEVDWIQETDLERLILKRPAKDDIVIEQIYLGTGDDNAGNPLLVFAFSLLDKTLPLNAEVAWVKWGDDSWDYMPNYSLPENAASMIDICPGSLNRLRGLFTLYRIQGQIALRFVGFPGPYGVSPIFDLDTPKGARCLATSRNEKGLSDLIVGGDDGLYHFTSQAARRHKGVGRLISGGTLFNDPNNLLKPIQQLRLSQVNENVSIWFKNDEGDVGYQEFNQLLDAKTQPTPLLLQGSGGGTFAALLNPVTQNHQVFVVGNRGDLRMLEQSGEKRLWQPAVPISYPSLTDTIKFTSYTTHVHVTDEDGALPVIDKKLRISSITETTLKINGIVKKVGPDGVLASTNASGNVTIIARSDDMTPPAFTIAEENDNGDSSTKRVAVDPAEKVKAKLKEIASSDKPEEHKLFKASNASPEVIQQGVAALKGFSNAMDNISGVDSDTEHDVEKSNSIEKYSLQIANVDAELGGVERTYELGGGFFQWMMQKFADLGRVIVNFVKGAWTVIVEWAGEFWNFVVTTGEQVLKATRWLLEDVLKIPITAIIEVLGFFFAWGDICDTQELLMYASNTGIDLLVEGVELISEGVDDFFDDIRKKVKDLIVPKDLQDQTHSPKDGTGKNNKTSTVLNSPGGDWSNYQLEHGGVTQDSSPVSQGLFGDDILASLDEIVQDIIKAFTEKIGLVSTRLAQMTNPKSKLSIGDILTLIGGDLADAFLEGTQLMVRGLLKSLGAILKTIKTAINAHVELPLISDLYRKMTGQDLTLVGAMSLLLAVPTTLLFKVIFGKRPRDIAGIKEILDTIRRSKTSQVVAHEPAPAGIMVGQSSALSARMMVQVQEFDTIVANDEGEKNEDSNIPSNSMIVQSKAPQTLYMRRTVAMRVPSNVKVPFWDRLVKFLAKVRDNPMAYLRDIIKLGSIFGNLFSVLLLPSKILTPGVERPTINRAFLLFLVKDFIVFFGTCPFWISDPLPLLALRGVNWGIGVINIGFCWLSKRAKAVITFGVGCLQAIMEVIILVADISSTVEENPNRPEGSLMITHTITVVSAQLAKISGSIALHTNGEDVYSGPIAVISALVVPFSNLVTYHIECLEKHPKHVHVISILGL